MPDTQIGKWVAEKLREHDLLKGVDPETEEKIVKTMIDIVEVVVCSFLSKKMFSFLNM